MRKRILFMTAIMSAAMALAGCGAGNGSADSAGVADGAASDGGAAVTAEPDANGNYIINGSFEEADFTGWTVDNIDGVTEELDIYTRDTDCYEGVQSLHFYSGSTDVNFTAEQIVSGLPAGTYKFTAHIQGDAAGDENAKVYFYAKTADGEQTVDGSLDGYVNWYTSEMDIEVSDGGDVTVGVSVTTAPGGWGTIDDITLVKE